jgi:hypothetical protein
MSAAIIRFMSAINDQWSTWGCGQVSSGSDSTLVNTVMNLRMLYRTGNSWWAERLSTSQERFCSMELIISMRYAKPRRKDLQNICASHFSTRFHSCSYRRNKPVRPLKYWRIPFERLLVLSRVLESIFGLLCAYVLHRAELPIDGYDSSHRAASLWQEEGDKVPWGR